MAWCWFPWLHSLSKWIHPTESCQTNLKKKIQKNTAYFAKLPSKLEIFWWLPTITDLLKLGFLNAQVEVTINQRTWSQKRNVTHFSRASFFLDGKWFKRLLSLSSPCLHQTDIKLNVKRKKTLELRCRERDSSLFSAHDTFASFRIQQIPMKSPPRKSGCMFIFTFTSLIIHCIAQPSQSNTGQINILVFLCNIAGKYSPNKARAWGFLVINLIKSTTCCT